MKIIIKKILDFVFTVKPSLYKKILSYLMAQKLSRVLLDLQSNGMEINIIYDIGARHATWAQEIQKDLKKSKIILFEANENCKSILEKSGFQFFIGILSSNERLVKFFSGDSTGDSYFKEKTSYYDNIIPTESLTVTLDKIVENNKIPPPNMIKLDTQGSEIDILKGGLNALGSASIVYIECPILNCNTGSPKLEEYIDFMKINNFLPYEICEFHHAFGVLAQIDILFIKKSKLLDLHPGADETLYFLS